MGKRCVEHDSTLDTPTNKKRKTESLHHSFVDSCAAIENGNQVSGPDSGDTSLATDVTYTLTTELVDGAILTDLCARKWRCGKPIGKGSFGEIFLASDDITNPVTSNNAKFVVKIEPHKSGPLFVEIHCLIKAGKPSNEKPLPLGMPTYMASGGHYFGQTRYRFLILPRYDFDLHSIIRSRQVDTKNILIIASQLIDILEHIHDCGYAHSDIKAENIMIGKCTYKKSNEQQHSQQLQQPGTKTNARSQQKSKGIVDKRNPARRLRMTMLMNDDMDMPRQGKRRAKTKSYAESNSSASSAKSEDSDFGEDFEKMSDEDDDDDDDDDEEDNDDVDEENDEDTDENEDEDEDIISNSDLGSVESLSNSSSDKDFKPFSRRSSTKVEFSGSNPMRSCRKESNSTETYDAMVQSHYLRRSTKKVNYCENDDEEVGRNSDIDDDDWGRKNSYLKRIYSSEKSQPTKSHNIVKRNQNDNGYENDNELAEDRIHLIDFGLALKFVDSNGVHRPFVMDQRRAHDGTLEFTSRDAHMGAHSRRSDLECLAYNLIYWKEGYLPWKNEKIMSQPEQVHRMKEYFMTDIKQLYKKFYNVPIPSFIYEFLTHVANLAYHDRPNYKLCKDIFLREFLKLGYKQEMVLNVAELRAAPLRKPETDECDAMNNVLGQKLMEVAKMMKMGMIMPFCETPITPNQISPKNLRSKATQNTKKRRTKFSWTEILSTDPDQIARQRAEKEFEREPCDDTPIRRYTGNPTYAIIQTENLKSKSKERDQNNDQSEDYIKGYNRAMMDVWRKRQSLLSKGLEHNNSRDEEMKSTPTARVGRRKQTNVTSNTIASNKKLNGNSVEDVRIPTATDDALEKATPLQGATSTAKQATKTTRRRKSGLRKIITPTKKISAYRETATNNRKRKTLTATQQPAIDINTTTTTAAQPRVPTSSENSDASNPCCEISSKIAWWNLNSRGTTKNSSSSSSTIESSESLPLDNKAGQRRRKYNSSCGMSSPASEEDSSHDSFDYRRPSTRFVRGRRHTSSKPLVIESDEESRDTVDYSPIKNRTKKSNGKSNRRNKRTSGSVAAIARGVSGRKVASDLIRTFTRG